MMSDDLIRQDERVQRVEERIRDEAANHADPLDFLFSKPGMRLIAELGAARVRVAIEQRKAALHVPPTREDISDAQAEGRDSRWMKEHPEGF